MSLCTRLSFVTALGCVAAAGSLRRGQVATGAFVVWCCFMYCFWRLGHYLPGVPPATNGIFRMQQVRTNRYCAPKVGIMRLDQGGSLTASGVPLTAVGPQTVVALLRLTYLVLWCPECW